MKRKSRPNEYFRLNHTDNQHTKGVILNFSSKNIVVQNGHPFVKRSLQAKRANRTKAKSAIVHITFFANAKNKNE